MADEEKKHLLQNSAVVLVDKDDNSVLELEVDPKVVIEDGKKKVANHKDPHHEHHETSSLGTFLRLWKANVGTGVLAMPNAISKCGFLTGIILILVISYLFSFCMQWLMSFSKMVRDKTATEKRIKQHEKSEQKKLLLEERNRLQLALKSRRFAFRSPKNKDTVLRQRFSKIKKKLDESEEETKIQRTKPQPDIAVADIHETVLTAQPPTERGSPSGKKKTKPQPDIAVADIHETAATAQQPPERVSPSGKKKGKGKQPAKLNKANTEKIEVKTDSEEEVSEITSGPTIQNGAYEDDKETSKNELSFTNSYEEAKKTPAYQRYRIEINNINKILSRDSDSSDGEDDPDKTIDYPDTVKVTYLTASNGTFHRYAASILSLLSSFFLILTHFCCCCVCFLFVAESISEVSICSEYFGDRNQFAVIATALPFIMSLSLMPEHCNLTGVIVIADLLQLGGLVALVYSLCVTLHSGHRNRDIDWFIAPLSRWPMFFSIVFYGFEGAGVTLHLQGHMKNKDSLPGWRGVYNMSMYFVVPLFVVVGALGYAAYGNDVAESVTFNLEESRLTDTIQILTCLGILLTYPFHFSHTYTPIKEFSIQQFKRFHPKFRNLVIGKKTQYVLEFIFRTLFVFCTYLWSVCFPDLELQISLAGAISVCMLFLFIPSFMYVTTYDRFPSIKTGTWRWCYQVGICLFGVFMVILCAVNFGLHMSGDHEHHHHHHNVTHVAVENHWW